MRVASSFTILHPCFFQYKIHFDEADGEWYRRVTNYMDEHDSERREVVRRWPICLLIEARPMPKR